MEKFEILNDYLDGNLNESQEKEILFELAANDELRNDFRQLIAVNRSSSMLAKGYFVPETSKDGIFAAIGMAGVSAGTGLGTYSPVKKAFPFLPALLTSAATVLVIFLLVNVLGYNLVKNESIQGNVTTITKYQIIPESISGTEESSNFQTKESKSVTSGYLKNSEGISPNSVEKQFVNDVHVIEGNIENEDSRIYEISTDKIAINNNIDFQNRQLNTFSRSNIHPELYDSPELTNSSDGIPLSIEVRNSQYWNIPAATVTPSRFADFNNMTIDIKYNFDNGISVGGDVRRENYFQEFDFVDELRQYTKVEQQPNFTTFSLVAGYIYNSGSSISPLAQISLGLNEAGVVSRLMVGAGYRISDNFSLRISSELSNLTYEYKSVVFNSPKFGFNYGICYTFR